MSSLKNWSLQHLNKFQAMRVIVDCGGLAHVTTMLTSSHARMLNEALVAITILAKQRRS